MTKVSSLVIATPHATMPTASIYQGKFDEFGFSATLAAMLIITIPKMNIPTERKILIFLDITH
jgi:hypothetical protein